MSRELERHQPQKNRPSALLFFPTHHSPKSRIEKNIGKSSEFRGKLANRRPVCWFLRGKMRNFAKKTNTRRFYPRVLFSFTRKYIKSEYIRKQDSDRRIYIVNIIKFTTIMQANYLQKMLDNILMYFAFLGISDNLIERFNKTGNNLEKLKVLQENALTGR